MKKMTITLLLTLLTMGATAQTVDSTAVDGKTGASEQTKHITDMPQYPGGEKKLREFLSENIKYPKLAEQYGVEGRVIIDFVVDANGTIKSIKASNCKINRFITTKFSQETESKQKELKEQFALLFAKEGARVVRLMPKWEPGKVDGKAVEVSFHLPITFRIPNK